MQRVTMDFRYFVCIAILLLLLGMLNGCASKTVRADSDVPVRGLYLANKKSQSMTFVKGLIRQGKALGINTFVMDVQPYMGETLNPARMKAYINKSVVKYVKEQEIFPVARVVCFQGGLKRLPVSERFFTALEQVIHKACKSGFLEVQLDYIRFADAGLGYSRNRKYAYIRKVLTRLKKITDSYEVQLSADVFGRIVYHPHDRIGQNPEQMAPFLDVLYPMLYPSHFTLSRHRMANPGFTIREGVGKAEKRLKGTDVKIVPYIQAFRHNLGYSGLSLTDYVAEQIEAAEKKPASGWVAWNARGRYNSVFAALRKLIRQQKVKNLES